MSRYRNPVALVVILLTCVLLITGCDSSASTPTTQALTTTPTTTIAPTAPATTPLPTVGSGRLTCTAPTGAGFPKGSDALYPTDQAGNIENTEQQGPIEFHADGSFNRAGTRGCYNLNAQQIVMIDDVNTFQACELSTQTGLYTWAFDGTLLSFTRENDDCLFRSHTLTSFKWKRQP
jgi:hypothetical protein